jgi:type II secretory pathway component PulJ
MQLVEVMVASVVFALSSVCSLQIWSQFGRGVQHSELREQWLQRMEIDRLQLQARWRSDLQQSPQCVGQAEAMQALAASLPVPPQLQRQIALGAQPEELAVHWQAVDQPGLQRQRWFSAAGLGLCGSSVLPQP